MALRARPARARAGTRTRRAAGRAGSCVGLGLRLGRGEAEADAADCMEVARRGGIVPELPAQSADVDVERLGRAEPVRVPDLLEQALAADDAAGLPRQQLEHLELLARELERAAAE